MVIDDIRVHESKDLHRMGRGGAGMASGDTRVTRMGK